MNLGERCDEIVRLIDETLADLAGADGDTDTPVAALTPLVPPGRPCTPRGRAAAGF